MFEDFKEKSVDTIKDLYNLLKKYSVPVQSWGYGESKTIDSLLDEIENQESIISDEGGYLVRYVEFVGIRVLYKDSNENTWILIEDRQEFKDGRVRKRNMPSSVSEKMKFGEDSLVAAIRGIREELNIDIESHQLRKHRPLYYNGGSMSYPGLRTKYKGHQYTCYLTEDQFNPGGYLEDQSDKLTFFKWIKK